MAMRHFLRVDGDVAVAPPGDPTLVQMVPRHSTLHLNTDDEVEAKMAEDIARHTSGWVEVDDNGAAVPTPEPAEAQREERTATAAPVVTGPGDTDDTEDPPQ